VNTIGAVIGSACFSMLVVPYFGTQRAQQVLIGVAVVSALLLLVPVFWPFPAKDKSHLRVQHPKARWAGFSTVVAAVVLAVFLMNSVAEIPWGLIAYGRYMATRTHELVPEPVDIEDVPSGTGTPFTYCVYKAEGRDVSVAVTKTKAGILSFHGAGKVQASSDPWDMRLQRMLGHISALLHKDPKSVLVVACGAGVTAGSFVVHPEVERIVICDIEPLVPQHVAPLFYKENYSVVTDPRTELVYDDGRHYIHTTDEKFDVITSDPIDPWVKGTAALNSVEYYQMCKDHLKPGGIMSLWMPLYESNDEAVKSAISTFFKVFPNGIIWSNDSNGIGYDAVLFGMAEPIEINVDELSERLARPDHAEVAASLQEVGFRSAFSLMATYAGQAGDLGPWMQDAQINTDRNMRLQYLAGMWLNTYSETEILDGILNYYRFPDDIFSGSEDSLYKLQALLQSSNRR
jgi:spermidine synthase